MWGVHFTILPASPCATDFYETRHTRSTHQRNQVCQIFSWSVQGLCQLKRSLYGLKQPPSCWNKRVGNFLRQLGFEQNEADPCVFMRLRGNEKTVIALHVDDGLTAATSKAEVKKLIADLESEFKILTPPKLPFPIDLLCRPYNNVALPCDTVMDDLRPFQNVPVFCWYSLLGIS